MFLKILITLVIVLGALTALRAVSTSATTKVKRDRAAAKVAAKRRANSEDMIRCEHCGAYYAPTDRCPCDPHHPS